MRMDIKVHSGQGRIRTFCCASRGVPRWCLSISRSACFARSRLDASGCGDASAGDHRRQSWSPAMAAQRYGPPICEDSDVEAQPPPGAAELRATPKPSWPPTSVPAEVATQIGVGPAVFGGKEGECPRHKDRQQARKRPADVTPIGLGRAASATALIEEGVKVALGYPDSPPNPVRDELT